MFENATHLDEIVDPLVLREDREDLMRYLGYRGPKGRARSLTEEIQSIISREKSALRPRGVFSIHSIFAQDAQCLRIRHLGLTGRIATFLAGAQSLAIFVVTVGPEISERSRAQAQAGNVLEAWVLDALGSWAADAAAGALAQHLAELYPDVGALSPRYSPGYCGMSLTQQQTLFELVDASSIRVSLQDNLIMQPEKSVSGVIGIGAAASFSVGGTPCDRCSSLNCAMRR